jgi:hypothetical protein
VEEREGGAPEAEREMSREPKEINPEFFEDRPVEISVHCVHAIRGEKPLWLTAFETKCECGTPGCEDSKTLVACCTACLGRFDALGFPIIARVKTETVVEQTMSAEVQ